jgi:hypothetical protein
MPKKTVETKPVNETPVEPPVPEAVSDESPKTPLESFIYHQRRALEETGKALEALLPEGFKEHGSTAGREFIKSFQVLVDAAINEIEKATAAAETVEPDEDGEDRPSTTGKTKVKVQVE